MEENKNAEPLVQESSQEVSVQPGKKKMSPAALLSLGVLSTIVVAVFIFFGVVFFAVRSVSHNTTIVKAAETLHIPAASVNGEKISYADYIGDVDTLKKFYASQGADFPPVSDQEISDMTISRLVANTLIEQLAKKYNVTVSDADVQQKKQELLSNFPNEAELNTQLQATYGWDFATYVEKVIKPLVREEKLQQSFLNNPDQSLNAFQKEEVHARHILFAVNDPKDDEKVKKQAEAVLARAKKGEDFAALAKQFGSDGTKDAGGDLGWFSRGDMVKAFEDAAFALEPNQVSDLVKTEFGYHIIRVDEKRNGKDFISFMDKQIAAADIDIYMKVNNPFKDIQERLRNPNAGVASTSVTTTP